MKIIVLGLGYVGLTTAACALKDGHEVHGIDVSALKVAEVNKGKCPIFEPGLENLLKIGLQRGNLTASTVIGSEVQDADLAIVCVGTPSLPSGAHNMSFIASCSNDIAKALLKHERHEANPLVVVFRSTVRPGTMEELVSPIMRTVLKEKNNLYELVYNPEFLRESTAIKDYFDPPKIVIGTHNGLENQVIGELYKNISAPTFCVPFKEAEITKFVDNSFHAVKVTFANEVGRVCARLGISASKVHEIFVSDTKLNISPYYLRPGGAFGGSCLPKDVRAFSSLSSDSGANTHLIDCLLRSNAVHKRFLFEECTRDLPVGAKVLLNGIAFKADSDDLRESPHVEIAEMVRKQGFDLHIYDPNVEPDQLHGANLGYQLANLPSLGSLLVCEEEIRRSTYDLVLDARGTALKLGIRASKVYRMDRMT